MTIRKPWPGADNPIVKVRFSLVRGFDSSGTPLYAEGTVDSARERRELQSLLEELTPYPPTIASVAMGEVVLELRDGSTVTLRPVFHPSRNRYADLFLANESHYELSPRLAELFDRWRGE